MRPASGRLKILAPAETVVRKGTVIGRIEPRVGAALALRRFPGAFPNLRPSTSAANSRI